MSDKIRAPKSVKPTPERVQRMLDGARERLTRLEAEAEQERRLIATLEAQQRRLEGK